MRQPANVRLPTRSSSLLAPVGVQNCATNVWQCCTKAEHVQDRRLRAGLHRAPGRLPESVTIHSATNAAGERIHVVHNWSWTPVQLALPQSMTNILAESDAGTTDLELGPWDVQVLAE